MDLVGTVGLPALIAGGYFVASRSIHRLTHFEPDYAPRNLLGRLRVRWLDIHDTMGPAQNTLDWVARSVMSIALPVLENVIIVLPLSAVAMMFVGGGFIDACIFSLALVPAVWSIRKGLEEILPESFGFHPPQIERLPRYIANLPAASVRVTQRDIDIAQQSFGVVNDADIPEEWSDDSVLGLHKCPISLSPIRRAAGDPNGKTIYDLKYILMALRTDPKSPITRSQLFPRQLMALPAVQAIIESRLIELQNTRTTGQTSGVQSQQGTGKQWAIQCLKNIIDRIKTKKIHEIDRAILRGWGRYFAPFVCRITDLPIIELVHLSQKGPLGKERLYYEKAALGQWNGDAPPPGWTSQEAPSLANTSLEDKMLLQDRWGELVKVLEKEVQDLENGTGNYENTELLRNAVQGPLGSGSTTCK